VQDLVNDFFRLSGLLQLLAFAAHGLLVLGFCLALLWGLARWRSVGQWVPVAPFFVALATLYALFLAFHASAIWQHKNQAERDFIDAATAIKRLDDMLSPGQLDLAEARTRLHSYVRYVFKDEWRSHNRMPSDRADVALRDLQAQIVRATMSLPPATAAQLNTLLNQVANTRSDRLWLGGNFVSMISWLGVLALGFLTHLSVAVVHLDRPRAGTVALVLLMVGTTVAYWTLGLVVDPYADTERLNPMSWMAIQT
jgi:hypothetical protein